MDRNELETKMQEAANRQSPKPYEERHLDLEIRPAAGRKRRVCVWRRVFARAGTDGACCSHGRTALLLSLLLVVVLAVILPLALCRQSERGGYIVEASAEEFYRELDLNAPDHYEEGDYKLLYDENGKLTGGSSSLSGSGETPGGYQFISFREEPFDDPRFYGEGGGVYVAEAGVSVLYYNEVKDDVYYTLATGKVQSQKFGPQYIVVEDYSYEGFEAVFAWFEKQFIA